MIGDIASTSLSNARLASLSVRNVSIHEIADGFSFICFKVCSRRSLWTLSKAPLTSMHSVDTIFLFRFALPTVAERSMAASTALRIGRPPICMWCTRLCFSARCARRVAIIFSEIFPRQLRRDIGRHAFGVE